MIFITIIVVMIMIMVVIRCAGTGTATYYQRQTPSASKPNRIVTHSSLGKNIIVVMVIIDLVVIHTSLENGKVVNNSAEVLH